MKNIQIIDGADNCTYSIFAVTDAEFDLIFPEPGQDVEFIEDIVARIGDKRVARDLAPIWKRTVEKKSANGIHGTLFYGLPEKKRFYPTKKGSEMIVVF